jgi:ribonuclease E
LKLRDLAGLIVIDFIDMEEKRNNRAVERRLKDALRFDRARIQLGRISHFGLMEMSRQRLRTGVLEGSTSQCPHCQGTGIIRSTESVALAVLRGIEDALMGGHPSSLIATTTAQVALYILNNKRRFITELEAHHGISIAVQASDKLQGANFTIEKTNVRTEASPRRIERSAVNMDWGFEGDDAGGDSAGLDDERPSAPEGPRFVGEVDDRDRDGDEDRPRGRESREEGGRNRRRRRRRGRRGGDRNGRSDERGEMTAYAGDNEDAEVTDEIRAETEEDGESGDFGGDDRAEEDRGPAQAGEDGDRDRGGRRRRRGRRGGRRGRGRDRDVNGEAVAGSAEAHETNGYPIRQHVTEDLVDDFAGTVSLDNEPAPAQVFARQMPEADPSKDQPSAVVHVPVTEPPAETSADPRPRRQVADPVPSEPKIERVVVTPDQGAAAAEGPAEQPARRGWWQRRLGGG